MMNGLIKRCVVLSCLLVPCLAVGQIRIGVTLSTSGPAAAIGDSSSKAIRLWPKTIAGQTVEVIVLDDASTPANAVLNTRKLLNESHVDVIVGPNTTPAAMAMIGPVAEAKTPMVALAASSSIVLPMDEARRWVFKMPQNDSLMATAVTQHMADHGIKTLGFIGFSDGYGESWYHEVSQLLDLRKIRLVANERYARTDPSVTAQVLKIIAADPDAVLIAGSATPATTPELALRDHGYRKPIYQTHGIATPDFLKVGGRAVEGTFFPTGPAVVARQLPADAPSRSAAVQFTDRYESVYGQGTSTQFAADAWDAWVLLAHAIPQALSTGAKPGTEAFRAALRDAIEQTHGLTVAQGVINMTSKDHVGLDQRARVMGVIKDNRFQYAGE